MQRLQASCAVRWLRTLKRAHLSIRSAEATYGTVVYSTVFVMPPLIKGCCEWHPSPEGRYYSDHLDRMAWWTQQHGTLDVPPTVAKKSIF